MGVLTKASHEYWATISGSSVGELLQQEESLDKWGVTAIEFRADLINFDAYHELLSSNRWKRPTFIAHFGVGKEADVARESLLEAVRSGVSGVICHSRCEHLEEILKRTRSAGKLFAAAYHSQEPMSFDDAINEFEFQGTLKPLFRKIACRAHNFGDALVLLQAVYVSYQKGGIPVVGAVFGQHRWARIAMPIAGSAITFLIAHQVRNEVDGDDEQLQIPELDELRGVRGILTATGNI